MKVLSFTLLLYLTLTACHHASPSSGNIAQPTTNSDSTVYKEVSILALISNPQAYDKHRVKVIGYLHLEFEGDCIYLHKEDFTQHIEKNGLWLDFKTRGSRDSLLKLTDHYVLIEGKFDSHNLGNDNMNSGCIKQINRLETWP